MPRSRKKSIIWPALLNKDLNADTFFRLLNVLPLNSTLFVRKSSANGLKSRIDFSVCIFLTYYSFSSSCFSTFSFDPFQVFGCFSLFSFGWALDSQCLHFSLGAMVYYCTLTTCIAVQFRFHLAFRNNYTFFLCTATDTHTHSHAVLWCDRRERCKCCFLEWLYYLIVRKMYYQLNCILFNIKGEVNLF